MGDRYKRQQGQENVLSSLNMAIDALSLAKEATNMTPAKAAFTSASVLLTMIRVSLFHVGRLVADVCRTRWSKKRSTSN